MVRTPSNDGEKAVEYTRGPGSNGLYMPGLNRAIILSFQQNTSLIITRIRQHNPKKSCKIEAIVTKSTVFFNSLAHFVEHRQD